MYSGFLRLRTVVEEGAVLRLECKVEHLLCVHKALGLILSPQKSCTLLKNQNHFSSKLQVYRYEINVNKHFAV